MQLAKGTTEKMWRKALGITAVLVFLGFGAVVVSLFRWQILRGEGDEYGGAGPKPDQHHA